MIAFTGSKEIGCRIVERAAKVQPGQRWIKRVIAEMGGKDPTVVCADGDLEAAALGIVQAAFGYAGQKCSACSRVIAEDSVYDALLDLVTELARGLKVGLPEGQRAARSRDHAGSAERIHRAIEAGKHGAAGAGRRAARSDGRTGDPLEGGYVSPTIFADVDARDPLFQEEIFGPVLAFTRARDWQHAIELANDSEYGLTAAFYSRDPHKIGEAGGACRWVTCTSTANARAHCRARTPSAATA